MPQKVPKGLRRVGRQENCLLRQQPVGPFIDQYIKNLGIEKGSGPGQVNVVMVSPAAMVSTYAAGDADGFMSLQEFGEPLVMGARPARSVPRCGCRDRISQLWPDCHGRKSHEAALTRCDGFPKNQTRAWTYNIRELCPPRRSSCCNNGPARRQATQSRSAQGASLS